VIAGNYLGHRHTGWLRSKWQRERIIMCCMTAVIFSVGHSSFLSFSGRIPRLFIAGQCPFTARADLARVLLASCTFAAPR